jgi:L-lactate utilization protein LutC
LSYAHGTLPIIQAKSVGRLLSVSCCSAFVVVAIMDTSVMQKLACMYDELSKDSKKGKAAVVAAVIVLSLRHSFI